MEPSQSGKKNAPEEKRGFSVSKFLLQPVSVCPPSDLANISLFPEKTHHSKNDPETKTSLSFLGATREIMRLAYAVSRRDVLTKCAIAAGDLVTQLVPPLISGGLVSALKEQSVNTSTALLAGLACLWGLGKVRDSARELLGPRSFGKITRAIDRKLFEDTASRTSSSLSKSEVNGPLMKVREQTYRIANFVNRNIEMVGSGALFVLAGGIAAGSSPLLAGALFGCGVLRVFVEYRSAKRFERAENIVAPQRRVGWGERWNVTNNQGIAEIQNHQQVEKFAERTQRIAERIERPFEVERKMRFRDMMTAEILSYSTLVIGMTTFLHPLLGSGTGADTAIKLLGLVLAMDSAQSGFAKQWSEHLKDLSFVKAFLRMRENGKPLISPNREYLRIPEGHIPEVRFKDACFQVEKTDPKTGETKTQKIVRNISLTLAPGKMYGICGPSGQGKTSLIRLLTMENEPSKGRIMLDGEPIDRYHPHDVRRTVLYLPQDYYNFHGLNVRESIEIGLKDKKQFQTAIDLAEAHFISNDPTTLNARMWKDAPNGRDFSGGERQRMALARALGRHNGIIIVDEPTAQLDEINASKVLDNLRKLANEGNTVIIISHDMLNLAVCDRIAFIDHGRIKEQGSHSELLQKSNGRYRQLWERNEKRRVALR